VRITYSMKYQIGVTLPCERGGDSIPTKLTNQTYKNLAKLKQSQQLNECLLACINLGKSSMTQKVSH